MDKNEKPTESEVKEALPAYDKLYTYSDYLTWDDDIRYELINGVPYMMSAPNRRHQQISRDLLVQFAIFLKGKSCEVYQAPFDVRLDTDTSDDTVVQPDLVIVCDHSKLDDAGCKGAPDMVVEILSPSTAQYDLTRKFTLYLKTGIREYWVIDPERKCLAVHILKDNNYITHAYSDKETAPVHILEGCNINLFEVFEE